MEKEIIMVGISFVVGWLSAREYQRYQSKKFWNTVVKESCDVATQILEKLGDSEKEDDEDEESNPSFTIVEN